MQVHSFARLPIDNKLYRLIGAGKVLPKLQKMTTARVLLWFAEVDTSEPNNLMYSRRPNGALSLLAVDEAAGSLPAFPLGSYWQDSVRQQGLVMHNEVKVEQAYLYPQKWQLVRARDCAALKMGSSTGVFPLQGDDITGYTHQLHDAPVLICESDTGAQLIIPCYEIFRRFYGVCSTLSNALLANHWQRELDHLIDRGRTGPSEDNTSFDLFARDDVSSIGCRAIALFEQCDYAKKQAQGIYQSLRNMRHDQQDNPWIHVVPPWQGDTEANTGGMTISFVGHQLENGATLVLWIYDSNFPSLPLPLQRVYPEHVIPVFKDAPDGDHTGSGGLKEPEDPRDNPTELNTPTDTKAGKYITHLALKESWSDLPPISRRYVTTRFVPTSIATGGAKPKRKRRLSTGRASELGDLDRACLSSDEYNKVKNRFLALSNSFAQLLNDRFLANRQDYALSQSMEINGIRYCLLPSTLGTTPISWGILDTADGIRSRLCWVSKLELADGSARYLFDIEAQEGEAFYAMVLKLHAQTAVLGQETLEEILKMAVATRGRWKKGNWTSLQGIAEIKLIRHQIIDGMVGLGRLKVGLS